MADDPQVLAAAQVIAGIAPDAILLTGLDWDLDNRALTAFADLLAAQGHPMPHRHATQPNRGLPTGLDLDGDGRAGRPRDAQGYGAFTGQSGLAILSRLPIAGVTDHSATLWRDVPGNRMPDSPHADVQRLSSTAHWDVALTTPAGPLHLLALAATPPAFEDRNPARNHDEVTFWLSHLPDAPFAILGNLNVDPRDGDGDPATLAALATSPRTPSRAAHGSRRRPARMPRIGATRRWTRRNTTARRATCGWTMSCPLPGCASLMQASCGPRPTIRWPNRSRWPRIASWSGSI
ncbi:endonuclease/exonuclease/phosphatase family protein [Paracoccus sp. PAMC 22219]|uniref:endonuclease/exonuclease/phosphatase family protein n=1 Tax=Paracoccus sp. PAMC 22219 TaxID=1569209 RepID=UPI000A97C0C4|nr:endonuclease/exonuclease/phosphatase family protein [Paracoccus sp. PAMC 22219]